MVKYTLDAEAEASLLKATTLLEKLKNLIGNERKFDKKKFVKFLIKYSRSKSTCKNIQDSYIIIFICLIVQDQNENKNEAKKMISRCQMILSKILDLHAAGKGLTSECLIFKITQFVLNETISVITFNLSSSNPSQKIGLCTQLLKFLSKINFELLLKAIQKIMSDEVQESVFSLLINKSAPFLPSCSNNMITLVLDLDETLGHFSDNIFHPRPGVFEFISKMNSHYELVLFTSAVEIYANYAMNIIDPENHIKFRLCRQHIKLNNNKIVKDLEILGRDMSKVLIVDNDPRNFRLQSENGIFIKTWTGESDDKELYRLMDYLSNLSKAKGESVQQLMSKCYFK